MYLFFLPFQLVSLFGYYTIPGVAMAAFIYLGFLAAGEEIEQPFGACSLLLYFHGINLSPGYDEVSTRTRHRRTLYLTNT